MAGFFEKSGRLFRYMFILFICFRTVLVQITCFFVCFIGSDRLDAVALFSGSTVLESSHTPAVGLLAVCFPGCTQSIRENSWDRILTRPSKLIVHNCFVVRKAVFWNWWALINDQINSQLGSRSSNYLKFLLGYLLCKRKNNSMAVLRVVSFSRQSDSDELMELGMWDMAWR